MTGNKRESAVGVFCDRGQAHAASAALQRAGFAARDMTVLAGEDARPVDKAASTQGLAVCGGGLAGVLIGSTLGAAATGMIPGVSPVLPVDAATAAVIGGQVGGGILGVLIGFGVAARAGRADLPEARASRVILIVKTDGHYDEAQTILQRFGAASPGPVAEDALPARRTSPGPSVGASTGERARDLATRFEQANSELIAFVERCSEAEWQVTGHHRAEGHPLIVDWSHRALCAHQTWSVGFVAYHIAQDHPLILDWVQVVAQRQPQRMALAILELVNAQHADQHASVGTVQYRPHEAVMLLRRNGAQVVSVVKGLNDEELARTALNPLREDQLISAEEIIEHLLIGHTNLHRVGIRGALGA